MQDEVEPRHSPERWPKKFAVLYLAGALLLVVCGPGGLMFWMLVSASR